MKPLTVLEKKWIIEQRLKLEHEISQEEDGSRIRKLKSAIHAAYGEALRD